MPEKNNLRGKVIVFFGLTASGKSYLAQAWAQLRKYPYYNTDMIRKQLAGLPAQSRETAALGQGIYSRQQTRRTYDEMISRARTDLQRLSGTIVVLDGSYLDGNERQLLVENLTGAVDVYFIYCYCSEAATVKRLRERAQDPQAVSDGRWEIYRHQLASSVIPDRIEGAALLALDTEQPVENLIDKVESFIHLVSI